MSSTNKYPNGPPGEAGGGPSNSGGGDDKEPAGDGGGGSGEKSSHSGQSDPKPTSPSRNDSQSSSTSGASVKASKSSAPKSQPTSRSSSTAPVNDRRDAKSTKSNDSKVSKHSTNDDVPEYAKSDRHKGSSVSESADLTKRAQGLRLSDNPRSSSRGRNPKEERSVSTQSVTGAGSESRRNMADSLQQIGGSSKNGGGGGKDSQTGDGELPGLGTISSFLPNELIDQILSYLLDHQKYHPSTESKPNKIHSKEYNEHCGRANTYRFHLAVTELNKSSRVGTRWYLAKNNKFVLVTFSMFEFHRYLHLCDVPIISDHESLASFNLHTVALGLFWAAPPGRVILQVQGQGNRRCEPDLGKILMLLEDLPKLCEMLKFMSQYSLPGCVYVMTGHGFPLRLHDKKQTDRLSISAEISRVSREFNKVMEQQTAILDAIRIVTGGGYKLKLQGLCDTDRADATTLENELRQQMAPSLIWMNALTWDQLDTATLMKQSADKLAESGDIYGATCRMSIVKEHAITLRWDIHRNFLKSLNTDGDFHRGVVEGRFRFLIFDIRMSFLEFVLLTPNSSFKGTLVQQTALEDSLHYYTPIMVLQLRHISMLRTFYGRGRDVSALLSDLSDTVQTFLAARTEWSRAVDQGWIQGSARDPYVEHDATILNQELAKFATLEEDPSVASIVPRLSPRYLGFRRYDSLSQCSLPTRANELQGWQDVDHLTRLSSDKKKEIMEIQKAKGLPRSEF